MEWLPAFLEPEPARIIAGIAAGAIGLGLIGLVFALASHARTLRWTRATAKILSSQPGFDLIQRFKSDPPRNERVAKIVYEFEAAGQKWRSGRILDSGHPPEDQIERLLAAYPAGKEAVIRYDPADPQKSCLEINGPPPDLAWGCLSGVGIVVVLAAIGIWLANSGYAQLQSLFPNAILPGVIAGTLVGLMFLTLFVSSRREAHKIARWPQVTGRVTLSDIHEFQMRRDDRKRNLSGRRRMETAYMPLVEYSYSVGGRSYSSRSVWADTEVSGSKAYAEKIARRYPVGATVMVYYDPDKPTRTALETAGVGYWFFLLGAVLAFAAALACSGLMV